jgi:hypothetical protein
MEDRLTHPSARDSNLMRSVNTNLRRRSESVAGNDPIAFFCECGNANCYSPIWMPVTAFDGLLTDQPGWLLHEGHEPSMLWHRRAPLPTRTSLRPRTETDELAVQRKTHGRPRFRVHRHAEAA